MLNLWVSPKNKNRPAKNHNAFNEGVGEVLINPVLGRTENSARKLGFRTETHHLSISTLSI